MRSAILRFKTPTPHFLPSFLALRVTCRGGGREKRGREREGNRGMTGVLSKTGGGEGEQGSLGRKRGVRGRL